MATEAHAGSDESAAQAKKPLLFISHRHEDKPLADALGRFVRQNSLGRVDVFQSSEAKAEGPRQGEFLTEQLAAALWRTAVVVLIYTRRDADWGWCMYECGLALHPESPDTRVIVLSCDATTAPPFEGRVSVKIRDRADIQRFTNDFLTDPTFFPRFGEAVAPGFHPNDENVIEAATRLFDAFDEIEVSSGDQPDDWPAFPFLRLQLEPSQHEELCRRSDSPEERLQAAIAVLREATIQDADDEVGRVFGRRRPAVGTRFGDLVEAWTERFPQSGTPWLESLADQVQKGADWAFPPLRWDLMCSMDDNDGALYAPMVTRIRRWPSRRMQFDVYFEKFTCNADGTVRLRLPQRDPPDAVPAE